MHHHHFTKIYDLTHNHFTFYNWKTLWSLLAYPRHYCIFCIGRWVHPQEKTEEDRYMRAQEEAWKEKLRALRAVDEQNRVASHHAEVVDPVKKDIEKLLATTGDKVSDAGLEALAKFRLDL
jgi:hypothetical protein